MATITMKELLEAGIHFGHQTRRWNPKMGRYIFGERHGIYIIDLKETLKQLRKAYISVRDVVADGGTVLFVGTKKQAREPVQAEAERCGMYHVTNRWLGGTLTNWQTIQKSIDSLASLEYMETSGKLEQFTKKEVIQLRKKREKLDKNLSGIKDMKTLPDVLFVVDSHREDIAVAESRRIGIASVAICDTNSDPDAVTIPIPGNDDAIRSISLFCRLMADAVLEGKLRYEKALEDQGSGQHGGATVTSSTLQRQKQRVIPADGDQDADADTGSDAHAERHVAGSENAEAGSETGELPPEGVPEPARSVEG